MSIRDWILDGATAVTAVAAVSIAVAAVARSGPPDPFRRDSREIEGWEEIAAVGHRLGPARAAVTIVEFGDYECPACQRFAAVVEELMTKRPNDVTLVYRHWPLPQHPSAYPAARAAECAGDQGRFWEFHKSLYTQEWSRDSFVAIAESSGVRDMVAFENCVRTPSPHPSIEADIAAAESIEAFGTPALIVNGTLLGHLPGIQDLEDLVQAEVGH